MIERTPPARSDGLLAEGVLRSRNYQSRASPIVYGNSRSSAMEGRYMLCNSDPETTTTGVWPTRTPGDPAHWTEADEPAEECPVHEYLLDDGRCDICSTDPRPVKSIR